MGGYQNLPDYYVESSNPLTPNLGLSLLGMDPVLASNMVILDNATGGTSVFVNGVSVSNPDFNDTLPAAPPGFTNVIWQVTGSEVSAYVPTATGGTPGGSDTQIQFNDSGAFGGDARFAFDKTTGTILFPDGATWDDTGAHDFEARTFTSGVAMSVTGNSPYSAVNNLVQISGLYSGTGDANISALVAVTFGNSTADDVTSGFGLDIAAVNIGGGTLTGATGIIITPGGENFTGVQVSSDPSNTITPFYAEKGISFFADGFRFLNDTTGPIQQAGTGSPEGVVTAAVSSLWMRTDGGTNTSLYRKESGSGNTGWVAVANSTGTVTSVAVTVPSILSVSGSPITTSGTIAITLANESANLVFAGPVSGGSATPTFRSLVAADMPAGTGTVTSFSAGNLSPLFTTSVATATTTPALTFSLTNAAGGTLFGNNGIVSAAPAYTIAPVLGIPGTSTGTIALASSTASGKFTITAPASVATPTLTLPTTSNVLAGQLAGDGTIFASALVTASAAGTLTLPTPQSQTANTVFAGPTSGGAAAPTFRALVNADIATLVKWSDLQNASAALTLSNGTNATTFNQTSAVIWSLLNTTAATSGTSQSSPIHKLGGRYWTGAADAEDSWSIQNIVANGTNGTSTLTFTHAGSTGVSSVKVPKGALGTSGAYGLGFGDATVGLAASGNIMALLGSASPTLRFYNGTAPQAGIGGDANNFLILAFANPYYISLQGRNTGTVNRPWVVMGGDGSAFSGTGAGTHYICTIGTDPSGQSSTSGTFAPASGATNFVGLLVNPTINQTSTASGNYTGLVINAIETSLKGSANLLLDLQAGVTGGTSQFAINNSGVATKYAATTLVSQGIPSEIVTVDLTAQTAAIAATTLISAPATGMYRISWSATITTAGTTSVLGGTNGFQVVYTSPTDSVAKTTVAGLSVTSAANTTATAVGGSIIVYSKTGTNIQYSYDYASTGTAMAFELHIKLERM